MDAKNVNAVPILKRINKHKINLPKTQQSTNIKLKPNFVRLRQMIVAINYLPRLKIYVHVYSIIKSKFFLMKAFFKAFLILTERA